MGKPVIMSVDDDPQVLNAINIGFSVQGLDKKRWRR